MNTVLHAYQTQGQVSALAWSPSGDRLAVAIDNSVEIPDTTNNNQLLHVFQVNDFPIHDVAWNPQRNEIASAGGDGVIRRWDTVSGAALGSYEYGPPPELVTLPDGFQFTQAISVSSVAWSPDGQYLAAVGSETIIKVWDTVTNMQTGELDSSIQALMLYWVGISPDGSKLAAVGRAICCS